MSPNRLLDEKQQLSELAATGLNGNGKAYDSHFDAGLSLADVMRSVMRHKWKVACVSSLIVLASVVTALYWPKTYRSEAKLFVRVGRQSMGQDPTANLNRTPVALQVTREEELNTVVDLLRSRPILEKVVDAVGPEAILNSTPETEAPRSPSWFSRAVGALFEWKNEITRDVPMTPREQAIKTLETQLDVQTVRRTDVINVTHDGRNPQTSQRIVASLIKSCLEQHIEMNRSPGTRAVLGEEASIMNSQLVEAENALRLFKNKTGLASPVEQRQALVNQIAHLEGEVAATTASAAAAEAENRSLSNELASVAPLELLNKSTGNPNFAADGMRQQLYTLQLKEKELASRVTDKHFELKNVRAQIAAATPILEALEPTRTQTSTGRNHIHEELRLTLMRQTAILASQRARSNVLNSELADAKSRLEALNDNEIRIAQLQRDAQILDASYRRYADSREQARLEESLDREKISNMTVAEAATFNSQPIRPQRSLILLAGCLIALFGAPCLAMLAERRGTARKPPHEETTPASRPPAAASVSS